MWKRFQSWEKMIEINPKPTHNKKMLPRYMVNLTVSELNKTNDNLSNIKTETIERIAASTVSRKEAIEFFEKIRKDFK
jgi:hypothetical protein